MYGVWCSMKARCNNPAVLFYERYGGRGIRVCDDWNHDYHAFQNWALTHGYESGLVLDRKDNDGDYTPDNCRWVTYTVNAENRSNAVMVTAWGETQNVSIWARDARCQVKEPTLRQRIRNGWDPEEAMTAGLNTRPRPRRPHLTYCLHGHPFSGDNLKVAANGTYICKTCARARNQRYKDKKRQSNKEVLP